MTVLQLWLLIGLSSMFIVHWNTGKLYLSDWIYLILGPLGLVRVVDVALTAHVRWCKKKLYEIEKQPQGKEKEDGKN